MNVKLYRTTDDPDTINRSKTLLKTFSNVKTKGPINSSAPSLILTASEVDLDDANYMYIQEFDRYYFITRTPMPGGVTEVNGDVDVLALPGISNIQGIIVKGQSYTDEYIQMGDTALETREEQDYYEFPDTLGEEDTMYYYMMCAGNHGAEVSVN